jgi:hypothetical protein
MWSTKVEGEKAKDMCLNKVRLFRKKAKGWSINVAVGTKKRKKELSVEYNKLDIMSETQYLNT